MTQYEKIGRWLEGYSIWGRVTNRRVIRLTNTKEIDKASSQSLWIIEKKNLQKYLVMALIY